MLTRCALFIALLGLSIAVQAQTGKTVAFCDHNGATFEDSLFMDLYFDFDPVSATYHSLEVGILNHDNTGYPEYLWTVQAVMDGPGTQGLVSVSSGTEVILFALPATEQNIAGNKTPGFSIPTSDDDKVLPFQISVSGIFAGQLFQNLVMNCYDPSLIQNLPPR